MSKAGDDSTGAFGRLWNQPRPSEQPDADEPPPRRQQDALSAAVETPPSLAFPENRVYVPFEKRSRPEDLILFCATLPAQFPSYHHLVNYSLDQHHGQFFTLYYPFMTVNVRGQRLAEIVYAINFRKCAIIREWHRDLYDPPTRGIAVVEKIEIVAAGQQAEE